LGAYFPEVSSVSLAKPCGCGEFTKDDQKLTGVSPGVCAARDSGIKSSPGVSTVNRFTKKDQKIKEGEVNKEGQVKNGSTKAAEHNNFKDNATNISRRVRNTNLKEKSSALGEPEREK
jgi:hypothetical protein